MSATKTTIVALLVIALTFTAGVMVGVFVAHIHMRGEPSMLPAKLMVNRLDHRLDLTDAQRAQVEAIIRRHHTAISSIWEGMHPRVRAEIEQANDEITRILTPEQRRKFERIKLHLGARQHS